VKPIFARVHALVKSIPKGRVATYGQLSQLIDGRLTPVGIGWAMSAAAPDVPWHRVINSKGGISTGNGMQRAMLEAEGVVFQKDGTAPSISRSFSGSGARPPKRSASTEGFS
jgi:methylated-DNA-protein-cysteine methyltransferase-like protein